MLITDRIKKDWGIEKGEVSMQLQNYEREHLEKLRSYLAECTVLLKANGDFPLEKAGKIAAYGSGVRNTIKGGTGSGEVNSRFFINIEKGLEDAGFIVSTKAWLDAYEQVRAEARKEFHKVIKARAKANHTQAVIEGMGAVMPEPEYQLPLNGEGDTAIYVLSRISGEGNDRKPESGDILLSETEKRDILALNQKYTKFMLILNVGGAVDLTPVAEVDNILVLSQLGVETGAVLADILLGKAYPSGKLATTWAAWQDDCAVGEFGEKDDTRYTEGIYVGYRYFDTVGKRALFPFGYGLGYTTFAFSDETAECVKDTVIVTVTVTNTGDCKGKETVQVYVSAPNGKLDKPYQTLTGFAKTKELAPGEPERVKVIFKLSDFASYDTESASYLLEKGDYVIRVGNSSTDTKVCAVVSLDETVLVRKVKNVCGNPGFEDWKPETRVREEKHGEAVRLSIKAAEIVTDVVTYDAEQEIDPVVQSLSDEQLAYLNIGAFHPKGGILSVIGNASTSVAGAAGETTNELKQQGFPILVMADGPAGLRLAQKYYEDRKGIHSLGAPMPESFLEFLPKPVAWFMSRPPKVPKNATVKYQYTTAIPIGTAIAQSFNLAFAQICGDIVGAEMERFGVHLWLAPALNIHRSIRCGRNFEYYSEDPLVSGLFAAEITKGVQIHPGCGTTIKHYAANNQETNRYANNSLVSERAMREIYLRGFEYCVKEAQPHALMTSYNLLNGIHTSEHRGLTEDILRSEYGYEGIVMTDWVTGGGMLTKGAKYPEPNAGKVAAAGGDLFMPGCSQNYREVTEALKDGTLSRKQLEKNASRVYRMAKKLAQ